MVLDHFKPGFDALYLRFYQLQVFVYEIKINHRKKILAIGPRLRV
jgi:hypothetical protein